MDISSRVTMQEIRLKAEEMAQGGCTNPQWKRGFEKLADAADHMDAMMARAEAEAKNTGPGIQSQ